MEAINSFICTATTSPLKCWQGSLSQKCLTLGASQSIRRQLFSTNSVGRLVQGLPLPQSLQPIDSITGSKEAKVAQIVASSNQSSATLADGSSTRIGKMPWRSTSLQRRVGSSNSAHRLELPVATPAHNIEDLSAEDAYISIYGGLGTEKT